MPRRLFNYYIQHHIITGYYAAPRKVYFAMEQLFRSSEKSAQGDDDIQGIC